MREATSKMDLEPENQTVREAIKAVSNVQSRAQGEIET